MNAFYYCCLCDGELNLLGKLGRLAHLRCRNCGIQCTAPAEEFPDAPEEDDEFAELVSQAATAVETIDADELEQFAWESR